MSHTKDRHTKNVHHLGMPHENESSHGGKPRENLAKAIVVLVISPRESAAKANPSYLWIPGK
jgi:hypothetical protein